ncbi:MAG: glycosyltransferase [Acidobacteria bacterium]|nr:glycosyltransferase [Acidobacteriota bacterium]
MGQPAFSIVVPTFSRPERLKTCIESMCGLDYDRSLFDLVIVDDGSPDFAAVEAAVRDYRGRLQLQLVGNAHGGPASARNAGARHARGEYVAFTDDDCRVDPGWLAAFARQFAAAPRCIAGGRTVNALADNVYTAASESLVCYMRDYHLRKGAPFFATNNLALHREVLAGIGGFDERFPLAAGEDREFCDRCVHSGHAFAYVADAVVLHYHALSLRRFVRQHYNYGRGAFFFRQLHADRERDGQIELEPWSFYTNLLTHPLSNRADKALRLSLLMVVSQFANTTGFFVERARRSRAPEARS